jgi:hypothetical protein
MLTGLPIGWNRRYLLSPRAPAMILANDGEKL